MYVHTFEGLTEEGEGGLLVADGGAVDEGFDGGFGVARGVSFEYASQHLRGLSSSEVRRTIHFAAAAEPETWTIAIRKAVSGNAVDKESLGWEMRLKGRITHWAQVLSYFIQCLLWLLMYDLLHKKIWVRYTREGWCVGMRKDLL
ncbi:hypothetical protein CKAN_00920300 [Cinnamomum micranthum f. kanehirae]|uniref:Uncharacterized protein n=1 Tax=Cinnamomum micranthum f. kanehirae TaxID=337451 RepID=A0A3S4NRA8_9MAGN|nr:hypothetical protein CKAN_00920300 [Cinnamomum micranthum f. kanehirae]